MIELVLLVEPETTYVSGQYVTNPNARLRVAQVPAGTNAIRERERTTTGVVSGKERFWLCRNDERALTGQRIFREELPPVKDDVEKPLYDELVLKEPLQFHGDETPLGFRRKWLRKN